MCNKVCEIFEDSWQLMVEMGAWKIMPIGHPYQQVK
jgi:hypothetical protein